MGYAPFREGQFYKAATYTALDSLLCQIWIELEHFHKYRRTNVNLWNQHLHMMIIPNTDPHGDKEDQGTIYDSQICGEPWKTDFWPVIVVTFKSKVCLPHHKKKIKNHYICRKKTNQPSPTNQPTNQPKPTKTNQPLAKPTKTNQPWPTNQPANPTQINL